MDGGIDQWNWRQEPELTHKYSQMFFDKRVKTHGIKKKKGQIFSRNGAGISEDPCQKKIIKSRYWKQYIYKIKLLFITPTTFTETLFFIPYKQ